MTSSQKRRSLTTDDLLRRQEEPARKKSKTSLGFNGLDELSSEELGDSDVTLDQERSNDEFQRRSTGEEEHDDDDSMLDGESLRLGEPGSRFSVRSDFRKVQKSPRLLGATFASLGISAPLQSSLNVMSIRTPTEVQAACIPPLLAGQ